MMFLGIRQVTSLKVDGVETIGTATALNGDVVVCTTNIKEKTLVKANKTITIEFAPLPEAQKVMA